MQAESAQCPKRKLVQALEIEQNRGPTCTCGIGIRSAGIPTPPGPNPGPIAPQKSTSVAT